jgi:hypothetical protein
MKGRGTEKTVSVFLIFPPARTMRGQELAPGILPAFCKTGCYGVKGPVPSAVLDKFNLDQTSFCRDILSSGFPESVAERHAKLIPR